MELLPYLIIFAVYGLALFLTRSGWKLFPWYVHGILILISFLLLVLTPQILIDNYLESYVVLFIAPMVLFAKIAIVIIILNHIGLSRTGMTTDRQKAPWTSTVKVSIAYAYTVHFVLFLPFLLLGLADSS